MDLADVPDVDNPDLIRIQLEAFRQLEQEREDREMAMQMQNNEEDDYARNHAEQTLSPDEIAAILGDADSSDDEEEGEAVVIRRRRTNENEDDGPPARRRRTDEDEEGRRAPNEPDVVISRVRATLTVTARAGPSSSTRDDSTVEGPSTSRAVPNRNSDVTLVEDSPPGPNGITNQEVRITVEGPSTSRAVPNDPGPSGINQETEIAQQQNVPALDQEVQDGRIDRYGECTICFDYPIEPMGCNGCRKLVGCHECVKRWYRASRENGGNATCPLCRCKWTKKPNVAKMDRLGPTTTTRGRGRGRGGQRGGRGGRGGREGPPTSSRGPAAGPPLTQ